MDAPLPPSQQPGVRQQPCVWTLVRMALVQDMYGVCTESYRTDETSGGSRSACSLQLAHRDGDLGCASSPLLVPCGLCFKQTTHLGAPWPDDTAGPARLGIAKCCNRVPIVALHRECLPPCHCLISCWCLLRAVACRTWHLGNLIKVRGVVTRRSGVFPQLALVKWDCGRCGTTMGPFVVGDNADDVKPKQCVACQAKGGFTVRLKYFEVNSKNVSNSGTRLDWE